MIHSSHFNSHNYFIHSHQQVMVSRGFYVYDKFCLLDIFFAGLFISGERRVHWLRLGVANVAEALDIYRRAPFFVVERKHICNHALPYCHARGLETTYAIMLYLIVTLVDLKRVVCAPMLRERTESLFS